MALTDRHFVNRAALARQRADSTYRSRIWRAHGEHGKTLRAHVTLLTFSGL
jgi:hypothetical protein